MFACELADKQVGLQSAIRLHLHVHNNRRQLQASYNSTDSYDYGEGLWLPKTVQGHYLKVQIDRIAAKVDEATLIPTK